jgi:glycosyltransferase involved in cell wall biosynthesis
MNEKQKRELIIFDWGVSSFFGWGIYGLQLMLNWALRDDLDAVSAARIDPRQIILDPLETKIIESSLRASALISERRQSWGHSASLPTLVLRGLGNDLTPVVPGAALAGEPTIGVVFSEFTLFSPSARDRAKQYPLIIAGSRWNRDILAANGIDQAITVLQGVDMTRFHPAPKRGIFKNKFVVFSGGKLERRKGQDLVLQAFGIFAKNHPDAVLLTAWSSPWPRLAASLSENPALAPIKFRNEGRVDSWGWTRENGIPAEQVFHLEAVPHAHMPHILREADVALFPNRAEGGTNLVAMECMACGVPAVLSANTGHLDLINNQNCYPLLHQKPIDGAGYLEWGESDVDEIVSTLESVYLNRHDAAVRGRRGSEFISQFTWGGQTSQLADVLAPYAIKSKMRAPERFGDSKRRICCSSFHSHNLGSSHRSGDCQLDSQ